MSLFKEASKKKYRWNSEKGQLNVEDLWDLSLQELDVMAIQMKKDIQATEEESFIKTRKVNSSLVDRFEIIKEVINTKIDEAAARESAAKRREQRNRIAMLIAEKEDEALKSSSLEELKAMHNDLTEE